jgi:hypothetical protein
MKSHKRITTLLFLATLPMAAVAADPAQAPAGGSTPQSAPAPLFTQLDSNHDGYVTKDEAKRSADVTARFAALDTDRDGKIAANEYKSGMEPKR